MKRKTLKSVTQIGDPKSVTQIGDPKSVTHHSKPRTDRDRVVTQIGDPNPALTLKDVHCKSPGDVDPASKISGPKHLSADGSPTPSVSPKKKPGRKKKHSNPEVESLVCFMESLMTDTNPVGFFDNPKQRKFEFGDACALANALIDDEVRHDFIPVIFDEAKSYGKKTIKDIRYFYEDARWKDVEDFELYAVLREFREVADIERWQSVPARFIAGKGKELLTFLKHSVGDWDKQATLDKFCEVVILDNKWLPLNVFWADNAKNIWAKWLEDHSIQVEDLRDQTEKIATAQAVKEIHKVLAPKIAKAAEMFDMKEVNRLKRLEMNLITPDYALTEQDRLDLQI